MTVQVKMLRNLLLSLFGLCLSSLVWAQSAASLLVTTDTSCDWKLDGVSQGRLNVDDAKVVKTTAGEHLLQATSADGQLKWESTVTADSSAQKYVKIPLSDMLPTWTDPAPGLMWTRKAIGTNLDWNQASNYCTNLQLAGLSGYRLPTIDELAAIYDQSVYVLHIRGGIRVNSNAWSNSTGKAAGEAWIFRFQDGERESIPLDSSYTIYALCVRRSGA